MSLQCLSGLRPVDVMTTTCFSYMEGSWYPDPQLLNCRSPGMYGIVQVNFIFLIFRIAVCSAPPSPLNGSVQADDGRTYMEGDEVNFQCRSGLQRPENVTVRTMCTMEGGWRPDPRLQNCRSLGMYATSLGMLPLIELLIFRIAVCSAPPFPLNGSVQADDGRTYVEGDDVNFQCLSGWNEEDMVFLTMCFRRQFFK